MIIFIHTYLFCPLLILLRKIESEIVCFDFETFNFHFQLKAYEKYFSAYNEAWALSECFVKCIDGKRYSVMHFAIYEF